MLDFPLEENLPYAALALTAMAIFYGIYFGKMIAQKRKGIRTHQIGTRRERGLHTVEVLMGIATFVIVPVQLCSIVFGWSHMPKNARFTGFLTTLLGDTIFLISVLTMRDSWRAGIPEKDRTALVTRGIYAYSRNPAFLGFDCMYIGIFLLYANWISGLCTAFAIVMLHLQILEEEKFMTATHGADYLAYKNKVLRYLGRKR